jgi:hypothetical protein
MTRPDQDLPEEEPVPRPTEMDRSPMGEDDEDALILWMLSLTPTQRLEVAQGFVDSVFAIRNGRRA